MDGTQEVVVLGGEDVIVQGNSGSHQFGDATLYNAFGLFGVFQLIADGHALSRFHQFGQIGVQGVVRKPGQFGLVPAIVPVGKDNAQNFGGLYRVLPKGFIKVAHTEQQQRIRVFYLDGIVLLH